MKKINLLTPEFTPYGIQIIVDKIALGLEMRGYLVSVIKSPDRASGYTVPISVNPCVCENGIGNVGILIDSPSLTAISVFKHSIKYSVYNLDTLKQVLKIVKALFIERKAILNNSKIVVVSAIDCEYLSNRYKNKSKFYTVKNGVDIPAQKLNFPIEKNKFITLGFISSFSDGAYRDIDWFLKKIWCELPSHYNNKFKIIIAGKGSEKYKHLLEMYENVECVGEVDTINDFYNNIDFSLATIRKKSGVLNKVLESFSFNVPVIGLDYNFYSLPEFIEGKHFLSFRCSNSFQKALDQIEMNGFDFDSLLNLEILNDNYVWENNYEFLTDLIDDDFGNE